MADKLAAESREEMTERKLTEAQYQAAYKAWMDVRTRIDDSSRAVIAAIAEHVQYPSEAAPIGLESDTHQFQNFHRSLCERFEYWHDAVDWRRDLASLEEHIASLIPAAPQPAQEPRYTLDEIAAAIQAEGDRISWQGFGAETTFAKAVCARFSPAPPDRVVEAVKNLFQMRSDQRQFMGRTPEEIVAAVRQADAKTEGRA